MAPRMAALGGCIWSSEAPRYGGEGVVPPDTDDGWRIRGESATLLGPSAMTMDDPAVRIPWPDRPMPPLEEMAREEDPTSPLVTREWLVTNGLGGYASGTVATPATRRYHGLLVAALPAPLGRTMLIAHLTEVVRMPGGRAAPLAGKLTEFRLELGLPVWRYEVEGFAIERRVWMAHGCNTVFSSYELVGGNAAIEMEARALDPLPTPRRGARPASRRAVRTPGRRRSVRDRVPRVSAATDRPRRWPAHLHDGPEAPRRRPLPPRTRARLRVGGRAP